MLDKIRWFWRYYRRYKYVLALLIILTPIQAAFQVSIPRTIEFSIDYFESGQVSDHWAAHLIDDAAHSYGLSTAAGLALTLVILGLTAGILYSVVQSHRAWMNLKLEWLFRQDAFDRITLKGPNFFNDFRTGDLVTRMTDDVAEKLSWFACSGIFRLYEALAFVAFTIYMMTTIDPTLTLWTAGPLPILIVIFFVSASVLDKRYDHLQTRISRFNDVMEACFSGIRVVKAYVKEPAQKKSFETAVQDRRNAEISTIKAMTVVESMYHYIWQLGIIIVIVGGGYLAINSNLSVGKLSAFVYLTVYLIFPMFDIGQFLVKSRQSAVSINRLVELEKVAPMVADNGHQGANGNVVGRLTFENVRFRFPDGERDILDDISLEIEAGQTVAVVGRVGSGKSWLINMIPRLVEPTGGVVKLDGNDLKMFRLEDLRSNIGYVPQEPTLFSDTVKNNILFGRESVSDAVLEWAIDVAQLKDEIATFPKGIETAIGTRGMSISGGQKQRLALARALVAKPKILILDDCTSALDSRTETALWQRLHEVMPGMTAILITHRPDTLESADNIFVLDNGRVVETGRHHQLIAGDGHYARIYKRYRLAEEVGA
ncbi:MAG: ABC transporter ATP-binding protein/permease [candidate division Zixibacteria bacterium]|nr:ABC transporter ATP-binding protein/permease [candidate division Zixibacteria bacterium]MDH3936314.1 ABC transporter ATP-binding protein/permease [candidate division Zixibacteria bacterium]MDH4032889.1 ABC transporter ATP-binding protein/permease [candidate division Zixibacteria bacterium]